jgi:glycosyltransferase involved in cell wall biosynthesis
MPRVSIIMPVRDARPWLVDALESIRAQSERDWELLIVDDGSTDGSGEVVDDFRSRDARIKMIETKTAAGGIVTALNTALAHVSSPLTARMDADDISRPRRLALQCDALDADAGLFAVTCRVNPFPGESLGGGMARYFEWQNSLESPEELERDRFVESPILHPSVIMRSDILRGRLGGWRDAGWPEDWDLFSRAFEAALAIRRLPQTLYSWRLHPSQATAVDVRYSEDMFRRARAHFLARALRARGIGGERELWVLGAGPVGKKLGKALAAEGVHAAGFVDVDPKKIGGRVGGNGRRWPVVDSETLQRRVPRPFAIAAVGAAGGRGRIRRHLASWGWNEIADFYVAA